MDLKKIIEVLRLIDSTCSDASLTGIYSDAKNIILKTYNELLDEVNVKLDNKFSSQITILNKLNEDANMDEIGFAASVLITLLDKNEISE